MCINEFNVMLRSINEHNLILLSRNTWKQEDAIKGNLKTFLGEFS